MEAVESEIKRYHEEIGISLLVVSRMYRRELDGALKEYGLSEANALPLRFLAGAGRPLKQKELAEILSIESASLVGVLEYLEQAGLIVRLSDKNDKRVRLVALSEEGRLLNERLHRELLYIRMNLFKGMDKEELQNFIKSLNKVDENLRGFLP